MLPYVPGGCQDAAEVHCLNLGRCLAGNVANCPVLIDLSVVFCQRVALAHHLMPIQDALDAQVLTAPVLRANEPR